MKDVNNNKNSKKISFKSKFAKLILSVLLSLVISVIFNKITNNIPNLKNIEDCTIVLFILLIFPIYKNLTNNVRRFNMIWLAIQSGILELSALEGSDLSYFNLQDNLQNMDDARDPEGIFKSRILFSIIWFGIISAIISVMLLNKNEIAAFMILFMVFACLIPCISALLYSKLTFENTKFTFENTRKEKIALVLIFVILLLLVLCVYMLLK